MKEVEMEFENLNKLIALSDEIEFKKTLESQRQWIKSLKDKNEELFWYANQEVPEIVSVGDDDMSKYLKQVVSTHMAIEARYPEETKSLNSEGDSAGTHAWVVAGLAYSRLCEAFISGDSRTIARAIFEFPDVELRGEHA